MQKKRKANNEISYLSLLPGLIRDAAAYVSPKVYWFNSLFFANSSAEKASPSMASGMIGDTVSSRPRGKLALPTFTRKPEKHKHQLPALPYATSALFPFLDARTLNIHHDIHHAAYINRLNLALESAPHLQEKTPEWLLLNLDEVPIRVRSQVRDNAGGHLNHSIMWRSMTPNPQSVKRDNSPTGPLALAIDKSFGSFENFKLKFEEMGVKLLGSGWVWLIFDSNNALKLMTTSGHINPITSGCEPLLVVDVWEHAYYLKYLNRRDKYLHAWWSVTNWIEVETRYDQLQRARGLHPPNSN